MKYGAAQSLRSFAAMSSSARRAAADGCKTHARAAPEPAAIP